MIGNIFFFCFNKMIVFYLYTIVNVTLISDKVIMLLRKIHIHCLS